MSARPFCWFCHALAHLYCIVLYCIVLYCIVLYCIVLYLPEDLFSQGTVHIILQRLLILQVANEDPGQTAQALSWPS